MKISKIIFLGVLALTSGQDPPDPDTTQPAEPTEERIKLTLLTVIQSPYLGQNLCNISYVGYFMG